MSECNCMSVPVWKHTKAIPIKPSSNPKAFTILRRTKHLSEYAKNAVMMNALFTPRSSGPRFGIDIVAGIDGTNRAENGKPQDQILREMSLSFHIPTAVDLDSG